MKDEMVSKMECSICNGPLMYHIEKHNKLMVAVVGPCVNCAMEAVKQASEKSGGSDG